MVLSGLFLGTTTWLAPIAMRKWNPDQSHLTPLDQLTLTEWVEPVNNPETELVADEIGWLKELPYRFRYKLKFNYDVQRILTTQDRTLVLLDQKGSLHGFDTYSGLNHWQINLKAFDVVHFVQVEKNFFLLDRSRPDTLRVSCIDLHSPAVLWQRTIPNSKDGQLSFVFDTQTLLVTTGANGIWALKSKTGEIEWKRPEIFTRSPAIPSPKHILIFEPAIAKHTGSWYFLDPLNGKTLIKSPHVYSEIQGFVLGDPSHNVTQYFLGEVDEKHFFNMNPIDLTQLWSYTSSEYIEMVHLIDETRFFLLDRNNTLEQRSLKSNDLIWQKKLTDIHPVWLKVSPNHQYFVIPRKEPGTDAGVGFFDMSTGDYLLTAKTTEPLVDIFFYGDWFYLVSESHLWSFQHQAQEVEK